MKSQTIAAQRQALRKRNWIYYVIPWLEVELSCRSCGSGNIMVRDAPHPAASLATIHRRKKAL